MDIDLLMKYSRGQQHLQSTFQNYFEQVRFNPQKNPNVLNIGCGNNCIGEFTPLSKVYREQFGLTLSLTCVDKTEEDFSIAKRALGDFATFIPGDAQNITELVDDQYGLVVIRHPNPEVSRDQKRVWDIFFMTHANYVGYVGLIALLSDNGYQMIVNEENPFPGQVFEVENSSEENRFDKFVVLGAYWV